MAACFHTVVNCLNHYDTIRKYRCATCGGVYICSCEQQLVTTFLPHQTHEASEYGSRARVAVNGYAPRLCAECRHSPEEPHPRAAIWGRKGKIERYYWREIFKTECELSGEWLRETGQTVRGIMDFRRRFPDVAEGFRREARERWQRLHRKAPKYDLREETEAAFLAAVPVPTFEWSAEYRQVRRGDQLVGKWVAADGQLISAEGLVANRFQASHSEVIRCERRLISSWYATLLGKLIQDPADPRLQRYTRQSTRGWHSDQRNTSVIDLLLPEDL